MIKTAVKQNKTNRECQQKLHSPRRTDENVHCRDDDDDDDEEEEEEGEEDGYYIHYIDIIITAVMVLHQTTCYNMYIFWIYTNSTYWYCKSGDFPSKETITCFFSDL